MHIPDGYLSPSTCATLYAGSAPFWYVSLQKMKRRLNTQAVPLLSVFAAFSFVIMMFNLPLPGGTTGTPVRIPFKESFIGFFTTTVRAGSSPSWTLEMLGQRERVPDTISYARVNLTRGTTSLRQPTRP